MTAIERGALSDWRRIASELRRAPWGKTAASLDDYLAYAEETGATALMRDALASSRAAAQEAAVREVAAQVQDLVTASGLSRAEFAARCHGYLAPADVLHGQGHAVGGAAVAVPANRGSVSGSIANDWFKGAAGEHGTSTESAGGW